MDICRERNELKALENTLRNMTFFGRVRQPSLQMIIGSLHWKKSKKGDIKNQSIMHSDPILI